jgi:hypothetical protein
VADTGPAPLDAGLTEALKAGARQIGAARMAAAVQAIQGEVHPDVIAGIEKLTGETYDPQTGTWTPADAR